MLLSSLIKLTEYWKAENIEYYPIQVEKNLPKENYMVSRSVMSGIIAVSGYSNLSTNTCTGDGARAWNRAPASIKPCKSLVSAKIEVKRFVKTLPI